MGDVHVAARLTIGDIEHRLPDGALERRANQIDGRGRQGRAVFEESRDGGSLTGERALSRSDVRRGHVPLDPGNEAVSRLSRDGDTTEAALGCRKIDRAVRRIHGVEGDERWHRPLRAASFACNKVATFNVILSDSEGSRTQTYLRDPSL